MKVTVHGFKVQGSPKTRPNSGGQVWTFEGLRMKEVSYGQGICKSYTQPYVSEIVQFIEIKYFSGIFFYASHMK